ncbi:CHAP domain-containing protein [Ktedonobacter robiniae]|uniref:Peptidase C51 domain-containing protein n=1 Tax=Ktedonobacter robiniae TaxID=2778365 RepID=A0ABQ3UGN5_9CHLR|nr:CHAP domain-containing protein [Ktedonobacter robiniae]GHO51864.1 hypothetical protein KSB_03390 [Ktedonobacter robiniae]
MTEHNPDFHPEKEEKDIEQYFHHLSSEDAQLLDDLRNHYSLMSARSTHILAHAWERIQQEQPSLREENMNVFIYPTSEIKREGHLKVASKKVGRLRQLVNVLVAAILLIVIVGSMGLVSSYFRAQTSTGHRDKIAITAVTPSPRKGTTPGTQGGQSSSTGEKSLDWPVGHDTYWANRRYHQLTGYWIAWHGDANQWVSGAQAAGWQVSQTPHFPSIIVLMPFVQGAGEHGHVGVVETLGTTSSSTTIHTSNMDWYINGGGLNLLSYADFTVGTGVYFIWHP